MKTHESGAAELRHGQMTAHAPVVAMPPARWLYTMLALLVIVGTIGLIGVSAWPTLRPVPTVLVAQAVFDPRASVREVLLEEPLHAAPTVQAAGWLEAEPYLVACSALADGVVERVEVLEGDRVEQGQVVARLVADDARLGLRIAEANLAASRAELALAEADRISAQATWDEPVELERAVEAGRAALAESEAESARLPALVRAARATLVRLEEERSRAEASKAGGAATELAVIIAQQAAAAQAAEVEALEATAKILAARTERLRADLRASQRHLSLRIEARRALAAAEAEVQRAAAAAERASAARDQAALELERMVIRAPISGIVQRRQVSPGDKVIRSLDNMHSAHVVHLYDPERLQVRVDVPLADASHVSIGQRCEIVVEVLPGRVFAGEVLRITHEADIQKNTLGVKVRVIDPSPLLRPEMLARVRFLGTSGAESTNAPAQPAASVLVPGNAIDTESGSPKVWLVTSRRSDTGVLRSVAVTIRSEHNGWVEVAATNHDQPPLAPGSILALTGQALRKGARVRIAATEDAS